MSLYGDIYTSRQRPGQVVQADQETGTVGAGGDSTGPHLHFGIITGFASHGCAMAVDPTKYVSH